jgi:hypothetical protein
VLPLIFATFPALTGCGDAYATIFIPERLSPLFNITIPNIKTSTALTFIILCVNLLFNKEPIAPNPNISGTVPILNINIENAPAKKLPVPKAYNCMDCNGPQGMRPFKSPTISGPCCFLPLLIFLAINLGILGFIFFSHGKMLSILSPIITIKTPANMPIIPLVVLEKLTAEPKAPTNPPITV